MKRKRINDIYTAVIEEAKKKQLATSELLEFWSYRENYFSNRCCTFGVDNKKLNKFQ